MSTKDLEAYWEARDGFTKELKQTPHQMLTDPATFEKFLKFKIGLDTQLGEKDSRALRAVTLSAHIVAGEAIEILKEMFPDEKDAPKSARVLIIIECQKKLCFELYNVLSGLVLSATDCLIPLRTKAQA